MIVPGEQVLRLCQHCVKTLSVLVVTVDYNVPYVSVEGSDLQLDIYRPSELCVETRSAVVLIHGGGWTSGDKSSMGHMAQFLASYGLVAYRLLRGDQNRWPAQLDDVQRAVRWVRANAAKYGVNLNRIGAFGHSAGATLASLLGIIRELAESVLSGLLNGKIPLANQSRRRQMRN